MQNGAIKELQIGARRITNKLKGFQIGPKRLEIGATRLQIGVRAITNRGRDFKSRKGLQIGAEPELSTF